MLDRGSVGPSWAYGTAVPPLFFGMAKKSSSKKKKKSGGSAPKVGSAPVAPPDGTEPTAAPPAAALGTKRGARTRPEKVSAKELSATAKQAARAKWDERMTAEGR